MEIEHKVFRFKVDGVQDDGLFEGYAATWDIDQEDDQFKKGAFKKTLRENKGHFPILDHHDPTEQLGWNLEAEEDDRGLRVLGKFNLDVQRARERHALIKQAADLKVSFGLSVGFRAIKWEMTQTADADIRIIKEARLFEYSTAVFPMNLAAGITGVKALYEPVYHELIACGVDEAKARVIINSLEPGEPGDAHSMPDNEPILKALNKLLITVKSRE